MIDVRHESITEDLKNIINSWMKSNDIDNFLIFNNNMGVENTENYYSFPYLLIDTRDHFKDDPQYGRINFKLKD